VWLHAIEGDGTMEEKLVLEKLRRRIGKPVKFGRPAERQGSLIDRAIIFSGDGAAGVKYWDVVDLIDFRGTKWIRIGYYRLANERLTWGSQTTIAEPVRTWKRLLVEAAREKPWFRELVESLCRDLR